MPVLEQFRNFIRHGKAAKDSPLTSADGAGLPSASNHHGYSAYSSSSAAPSSAQDGLPLAGAGTGTGTTTDAQLAAAAAAQAQIQQQSASNGAALPVPLSGDSTASTLAPTPSPGLSSASHGRAAAAAAAAASSAQQQAQGSASASGSGSGPGSGSTGTGTGTATAAHASVAAALVEEERRAASTLPLYEGLTDRFVLLAKMGDGAFSNVYKARDLHTGQKVAIKVVRKYELNSNQEDRLNPQFRKKNRVTERANILKEVQIMRGLKHESIVKLLEFSESRDHYYLVLELLEGGELFHQIVKLTYFSEPLARHVILQVARGIRYLHEERGVVHRDIKPENLLFESIKIIPSKFNKARPYDEEKEDEGEFMPGIGGGGIGRVKIADFGLSKIVWEESTMTPCGTVGYTAPEIVKDERYSKSVDMWALGCVLYTLLCGFPPFYDESISVLTEKVAKGYYTFLSPWWDDISKSAKDLITHLLCVDPRKRYTIDEFLAHPWCNVQDPVPDLNSADIALAKASEMPLDSPLLQSMKGTKAQQRANLMSPGINQLKEAFDVTYAVHRMEEEGAARKGYNPGNRGELMGLNEEEEPDEAEETARKYGPEAGQAVARQRGARGSDGGASNISSRQQQQQQQQQQTQTQTQAQTQQQQQAAAAAAYPGRGGADPKLAAAVLYDGRAGQRDRGGRSSNRRAFELNINNATLLGRRNKGLDGAAPLASLDAQIAAGGTASPMRLD